MPKGTRQGDPEWPEPYLPDVDRFARVLGVIESVADEVARSVAQVTLAWTRCRPGVGTIVLGVRNEEQLADNLASYDLALSDEQVSRIEASGRPRPLYPFWHRAMWGFDRTTPAEKGYLAGHRETVGA